MPTNVKMGLLAIGAVLVLATGALMWWNRALSREARSGWRRVAPR